MEPKIVISITVIIIVLAIIVWRNWPRKKQEVEEEVEKDIQE